MAPFPSRLVVLALAALTACKSTPDPEWHGLSAQIEVRRDEWGVPHIFAQNADDALYVLGYETARDRLFQLDLLRRRALGREAELFGARAAPDDRIARVLGFGRLGAAGEEDLRLNDPDVHRTLNAYAQGISAFIADARAGKSNASWPPEYADLDPAYRPEPWTIADTLAMLKAELFEGREGPRLPLPARGRGRPRAGVRNVCEGRALTR